MPIATSNPTGDEFLAMEDDGRRYEVLGAAVGHYRKGAVISAIDLGPGAQMTRLLAALAIRELSPEEIAAAEADPETKETSKPFGVVRPDAK